jgi:hypothetical protein
VPADPRALKALTLSLIRLVEELKRIAAYAYAFLP